MTNLTGKKCVPCEGKLSMDEVSSLLAELKTPWEVVDEMKITREFHFNDYMDIIDFVCKVAALAEEEGHHPAMHVFFSKLVVEIWTHAIPGLSENDFILAAKIEQLEGEKDVMFLE